MAIASDEVLICEDTEIWANLGGVTPHLPGFLPDAIALNRPASYDRQVANNLDKRNSFHEFSRRFA